MEKLKISQTLTVNASKIKSQLFLRNNFLKGPLNASPRNTLGRTIFVIGLEWLHPARSLTDLTASRSVTVKMGESEEQVKLPSQGLDYQYNKSSIREKEISRN